MITVTLDFIFRLVQCSRDDVSFNSICLNVLEGINQFYLLMWFKKTRLETPFNCDNVKALVKRQIEKIQKIAAFAMLFWFSVTKQSFENGSASPNDQKYPRYPLVLKLNVNLAWPLRLVILYFLMENLVR